MRGDEGRDRVTVRKSTRIIHRIPYLLTSYDGKVEVVGVWTRDTSVEVESVVV